MLKRMITRATNVKQHTNETHISLIILSIEIMTEMTNRPLFFFHLQHSLLPHVPPIFTNLLIVFLCLYCYDTDASLSGHSNPSGAQT